VISIYTLLPEPISSPHIKMKCAGCGFKSPVFLLYCPKCKAKLFPLELLKYKKLNIIFQELNDVNFLTKALVNESVRGDIAPYYVQIEDYSRFEFIGTYLNYYFAQSACQMLSIFLHNLRYMLKLGYLTRYHKYIVQELKLISVKIEIFKEMREKNKIRVGNLMYYNTEEVFFIIKLLYERFTYLSFQPNSDDTKDILKNYIILNTLRDLHRKLKENIVSPSKLKEKLLLQFKEYIIEFCFDKASGFELLPSEYQDVIYSPDFQKVIVVYDFILLYLPQHERYMLVKHDYTPNLKIIAAISNQQGGISIADLSKELGISSLLSEMTMHLLLRRNMMIQTYSYLHGERFYIK